MSNILLVFIIGSAFLLSPSLGQQSVEPLIKEGPIRGRIVAYDWDLHETTSQENFVVRVLGENNKPLGYVRLIYGSLPHDAPPSEYPPRLSRFAFIGQGRPWLFLTRAPSSAQEKLHCRKVFPDHLYDDGTRKGTIPRYVRTPGAEGERIPPFETLTCFVLKRDGLRPPQGSSEPED